MEGLTHLSLTCISNLQLGYLMVAALQLLSCVNLTCGRTLENEQENALLKNSRNRTMDLPEKSSFVFGERTLRNDQIPYNQNTTVNYTFTKKDDSSSANGNTSSNNQKFYNHNTTINYSFTKVNNSQLEQNKKYDTFEISEPQFNISTQGGDIEKDTGKNIMGDKNTMASDRDRMAYDISTIPSQFQLIAQGSPTSNPLNGSTTERTWNSSLDNAPKNTSTIYVGGLFDFTNQGRSEYIAAKLAIQHINEKEVIPGYQLDMYYNDTKCDPGTGVDALYHMVHRHQLIMLFGSSCSDVATMLGQVVAWQNLIFVSHAATSPYLSERKYFPTFYRLAAVDSSHNDARRAFIQKFQWDLVAVLHQDNREINHAVDKMDEVFEKAKIRVVVSSSFRPEDENIASKLTQLKEMDARIIIGNFDKEVANHVFCQAYKLDLYGARYQWILSGGYNYKWWTKSINETECTLEELEAAVDGYISVDSLNFIVGHAPAESGLTYDEFLADYKNKSEEELGHDDTYMSVYASQTYDTLWTIALTLQRAEEYFQEFNNSVSLSNFTYSDGRLMMEEFFNEMKNLEFQGVSGPVSFHGSDRQGITSFEQLQHGNMTTIALYYPENNTLDFKCSQCKDIAWKDGRPPADEYKVILHRFLINPVAFHTISIMCGVGMFLALVFLLFNLLNLRRRYIKLSSPRLNNVAVIGCIFVYSAVLLLGFDDGTLDPKLYPTVCTIRAFLFAAGFSLAFGAMFTKTYRVHQICIGAGSGLVKNKLLKDKHLFFIIGALLVFDSAIVSLWALADPMVRQVSNLTSEPAESDPHRIQYVHQHLQCRSQQQELWMGVFYAYKGLLLIFGTYMAWETRKVKIAALNDSQYIGMIVYNVVIMSVLVVALSSVLQRKPTIMYCTVSAIILISTTVTLCLLFLPKMYALIKSNGSPVITTSGLTLEANTRRLTSDNQKELLFRAEVQNKTYRRDMEELLIEIVQLEHYTELAPEYLVTIADSVLARSSSMRRRRSDVQDTNNRSNSTSREEVSRSASLRRRSSLHKLFGGTLPKQKRKDSNFIFNNISDKNNSQYTSRQNSIRSWTGRGGADDINGFISRQTSFRSRRTVPDFMNMRDPTGRSWISPSSGGGRINEDIFPDFQMRYLPSKNYSFRFNTPKQKDKSKVTKEFGVQVSEFLIDVHHINDNKIGGIKHIDSSEDELESDCLLQPTETEQMSPSRQKRIRELQEELIKIQTELKTLEQPTMTTVV